MPFATVAGEQVYYALQQPVQTSQNPVVFIHGAGGTHQHWLHQVRALTGSPSYAVDLPGHGRSRGRGPSPGLGRESIRAYGDWLLAFLAATCLDRAVLVGHSMGGAIALDVALRCPARVSALGLVATGARLRVAPAILNGMKQDPEAAVRLVCRWAFGPDAPEEMVRLGRRQMNGTAPDVLHGDFVACDAFDLLDQLPKIAAPSLILCGTRDALTPPKYAVHLRDQIAGAELHLIEGAGHMLMIEKPTAVSKALAAFLGKL